MRTLIQHTNTIPIPIPILTHTTTNTNTTTTTTTTTDKMMKYKDTRVSIINDALKGIKTIKVV